MKSAKIPENENQRLKALRSIHILDTPVEEAFDRITRLAKNLFGVPVAVISLVDENRQWFKSIQGLDVCETPRALSFCAHAILQDEVFCISDTFKDERFADHDLVIGEPYIRFYAGYPICSATGERFGTVCIIDTKPRDFKPAQLHGLRDIAALVEAEINKHPQTCEQLKMLSKLGDTTLVDTETRLWNRTAGEAILQDQFLDNDNLLHTFGLGLLELDRFEELKKTAGKQMRSIIQACSSRLLMALRPIDVIARWDDNQFLIVVNSRNKKDICYIFNRIQESLNGEPIDVAGNSTRITATLGITIAQDSHTLEPLLKEVKAALNQARDNGRGSVYIHGE